MKKDKHIWVPMLKRKIIPITNMISLGYAEMMKKKIGVDFDNVLLIPKGEINILHFDLDQLKNLGIKVSGKLRKDPAFANWVTEECEKTCRDLVKTGKKAVSGKLEKLSNLELLERFESYINVFYQFAPFMSIPLSVEQILPKKIEKDLRKILPGKDVNEFLSRLTTPKKLSYTAQEHMDLLKLAIKIKKEKLSEYKYKKELSKHVQKYLWLSIWNFSDPLLKEPYFEQQLRELLSYDLEECESDLDEIRRNRDLSKRTLEKLSIKKELRDNIKLMRKYVFLRNYRREMLALSYFHLRPLLEEVAKRAGLSLDELCHLIHPEIIEFLKTGRLPSKEEILSRKERWAFVIRKGRWELLSDQEGIEKLIREELGEKAIKKITKIKGNVACRGKAKGKVRVILDKVEVGKFRKGEVLVTTMTTPDFVVIMKQAVAIVTDEGGLTCHAAIISRELGIPCVVATKHATEVFKDGDLVEVDAERGIVRKLEK